MTVTVVSSAPVLDFPHNRRIIFWGREFARGRTRGRMFGFLNLTVLKHVTRFVSAVRAGEASHAKGNVDAVVVHGVNSALLWATLNRAKHWQVPAVVVITDPPSLVTEYDNHLTRWLKRLDKRLIRWALVRYSGLVVLAPRLAADLAPGKPWIVMEGIARELSMEPHLAHLPEFPTVVYAGGLHESYGVRDLIDAVKLSNSNWRLEFYGKGPMAAEIGRVSEENARVIFGGMLGAEQLANVYRRAALLVNPRPSDAAVSGASAIRCASGRGQSNGRCPAIDAWVAHTWAKSLPMVGLVGRMPRARQVATRSSTGVRVLTPTAVSKSGCWTSVRSVPGMSVPESRYAWATASTTATLGVSATNRRHSLSAIRRAVAGCRAR